MDDKKRMIFMFFLLYFFSGMVTEGQTLDVCATCHPDATCDDKSDGSGKVCNCKYGFVGNGRTFCQDKDECQIGASKICGQHTTCHNTYGSYYCTCLAGYSPSNNMDIFIPNDGTHCQDIDECRIAGLCGEGGQCRNLDGSFECSCQVGYRVHNGYEPFHPHKDKAFCKVVDCGQPPLKEDTVLLSVTGTTSGSVAVFACDEGFVWRKGENSSVCEADGLWRGATLVCEEIVCGAPPVIELSERLWNNKTTPGSFVLYFCKEGSHYKGGHNMSVCNKNGQWTSPTLSCQEILCGDPPAVSHTGQMWNGSSKPGSNLTYFCNTGFYQTNENNVSVCTSDGYWTKPDISCKEVDCGEPLPIPHTVMLWNKTSTVGSRVAYKCHQGHIGVGRNESICTSSGKWDETSLFCQEISCGDPPFKKQAKRLWDGTSHFGSVVRYQCEEGYQSKGTKKYSKCGENGWWEETDLCCEEINCGPPLTLPNSKLLWDGTSTQGSAVLYECEDGFYKESGNHISTCSLSGQWGKVTLKCRAKCGPVPFLANSEVVWHNRSVVVHRCAAGFHSWKGSNVSVCDSTGLWQSASLRCVEIKPPINHLTVYNAKCLRWKAEKYEEDTEFYRVTYAGFRDYQRGFHDEGRRELSSNIDQVKLCLNLFPLTNYSISVTAVSAKFTATMTTKTSLPVPSTPVVFYKEFETPTPRLKLSRSPSTLDLLSFYQVFVLPVEGVMAFDCSIPSSLDSTNKITSPTTEYISAQLNLLNVGMEMNFTVGDGFFYGGFYNAPLQSGKNYYIVLRAVTQWKMVSKSCCVLWAKVTGSSYVLRISSLSAAAVVGVVALVLLSGFSFSWCMKKS